MITAHAPSGYVLGRLWPAAPLVLPAAFLGGGLPDFDLIWFYFIDDRAFHHHRYWVHAPGFWALFACVCLPMVALWARRFLSAALAFFAALLLHICLDTIAGDIMWRWPASNELYYLVTVPARHGHWILNFVLHWVFALEVMIWALALWLWRRS